MGAVYREKKGVGGSVIPYQIFGGVPQPQPRQADIQGCYPCCCLCLVMANFFRVSSDAAAALAS